MGHTHGREDDPGSRSEQQPTGRAPAEDEEPMLFCPRCSARLTERRCKLECERCGYYMSCADYY